MSEDINIGAITEALNDKADRNLNNTEPLMVDYIVEQQLPTADNNYVWYNKYKSGRVEQGAMATTNGGNATQIQLIVPLKTNVYIPFIQGVTLTDGYSNAQWQVMPVTTANSPRTTTSFYVQASITGYNLDFAWRVEGMYA